MIWIAYAAAWISTSAAVITGMCITGNWKLLWFMILPALLKVRSNDSKSENEGDDDNVTK